MVKYYYFYKLYLFICSGIGVDEKSLISIVTNSNEEHKNSLRKGSSKLFIEDENGFEQSDRSSIKILKHQFKRFRVCYTYTLIYLASKEKKLH